MKQKLSIMDLITRTPRLFNRLHQLTKRIYWYLEGDIKGDKVQKELYHEYQKLMLIGYWKNKESIPLEFHHSVLLIIKELINRETRTHWTFIRMNQKEVQIVLLQALENIVVKNIEYEILSEKQFIIILDHYNKILSRVPKEAQYKFIHTGAKNSSTKRHKG